MSPSILYQDPSKTLFVIDIPCSIEVAQGHSILRNLLSSQPQERPFPSLEPKSKKAKANLPQASLDDLLLQKHLEFALGKLRDEYSGSYCLPRVLERRTSCHRKEVAEPCQHRKKTRALEVSSENNISKLHHSREAREITDLGSEVEVVSSNQILYKNPGTEPRRIALDLKSNTALMPPLSTIILGNIEDSMHIFTNTAPKFDLIVLDPPWPNRSARRRASYDISYGAADIRHLLFSIPLYDHLTTSGIIAVWITNKHIFRDMVLGPNGLFEAWDVGLIEEWIWLKTTVSGEPVCALGGAWRKPYEILLVGRRGESTESVKRRIIIGVPDLHSRKPNLKEAFRETLEDRERKQSLEVFARGATAGWWSWGNEVLKFQMDECWTDQVA